VSQSAESLAVSRLARILRWLVRRYLPAEWTSIEAIEPQLDAMLCLLQQWYSGRSPSRGTAASEFALDPGALLAELWTRELIEIEARRNDPLNPLTPIDTGRHTRREMRFTREGTMASRLTPDHPPRPAQYLVAIHNPRGVPLSVTMSVVGYDAHVRRLPGLWPVPPAVATLAETKPPRAPAKPDESSTPSASKARHCGPRDPVMRLIWEEAKKHAIRPTPNQMLSWLNRRLRQPNPDAIGKMLARHWRR
jgi:hypothetical protein